MLYFSKLQTILPSKTMNSRIKSSWFAQFLALHFELMLGLHEIALFYIRLFHSMTGIVFIVQTGDPEHTYSQCLGE